MYTGLLSRPEETASITGFDDDPRQRPCEHRREWMRGKLCLACDNTGWRRRARNEEGLDPYATEVKAAGVRVVESASAKRAREGERIDKIIEGLKRDARLRAGVEVREGPMDRFVRHVGRKDRQLVKIIRTIERLRARGVDRITPLLLAAEVPGRIREP